MRIESLATALAAVLTTAIAAPAFAGPDFYTPDRTRPLAASDAEREAQPSDDVVFAYDSAALGPEALLQLEQVAKWMARHPRYRLVLEGHASSAGAAPYNAALATRRLAITRAHLRALGVHPDRIVVALYGENRARVPSHDVDRRVIMFASTQPVATLVATELDRDAIEASWTRDGSVYRQTRGITPVALSGPPPVRSRPQ